MPDVLEDLATTATDAATARRLECAAADAQYADTEGQAVIARAREAVAKLLGDDAAAAAEYELEASPHTIVPASAIVKLCGVKLRMVHRTGWLTGLVTCPLCNAWDRPARDAVHDVADFGELLLGHVELVSHDAPDTGERCNGLKLEEPPEERPMWRLIEATDAIKLHEGLQLMTEHSYRPQVLSAPNGWIIVGRRIGDRFNAAYDRGEDDEPF